MEPIFRQAHECHLALRHWQRRWVELAEGVDYKLLTHSSFDGDGNPEQFILIRNSGTAFLEEIHFCVDARLGKLSYQVPQTAHRLRPDDVATLPLHGLPLQDLSVRNKRLVATYETVQVYPVRVVRDSRTEAYSTGGESWSPNHDDYLNGEWLRWRGRLYNVKAIADARTENYLRLAHALCWRHGLVGTEVATILAQALRGRRYRLLPGVLMFALVKRRAVMNAIVWARLLFRFERIAFECDAAMAAATEHVLNRGCGARPVRIVEHT